MYEEYDNQIQIDQKCMCFSVSPTSFLFSHSVHLPPFHLSLVHLAAFCHNLHPGNNIRQIKFKAPQTSLLPKSKSVDEM